MSTGRQDAASLGPGWNKTLHNYALAMRALDNLPITDRTSWKFLAAMHGIDPAGWVDSGVLDSEDLPDDLTNGTFGEQCQHGSWYFLPWHRAYLWAFEAIVAAKVKELTGDDWALPYWNYLDATNPKAKHIPDAFIAPTLPDGSENPLAKYPRDPGFAQLPPALPSDFSLIAMSEDNFLVGADGTIGFGGGITGNFMHFWTSKGDIERNPHDTVHGMIGGFMNDPNFAGLDPIFWLHHCNIDRLWEAWMNTPNKTMVNDPRWRDGPANRTFIMPQPDGTGANFTARDTLKGGEYHPTYDDLTKGTGVKPGAAPVARKMGPADQQQVQLVGANAEAITVGGQPAVTRLQLEPAAAASGVARMSVTAPGEKVSRFYLKLEGIKGRAPSPLVEVYVNLPAGADPHDHPDLRVAGITLFGLNVASAPDGGHGGNGLGYTLDITDVVKKLTEGGDFKPDDLRVTLVPGKGVSADKPVTVDQIAVLKRTGTVG